MTTGVRAMARALDAHGIAALPPREDGSKRPDAGNWTRYQQTRPTREELAAWYGNGRTGVGAVTGAVSGNLEVLEFDDVATYEAFVATAAAAGLGPLVARLREGYEEETPGGGIHWPYRCDEIAGNTKLACRPGSPDAKGRPTAETLIETRGEGGYIVLAPSHGRVHPTGRPYVLRSGGVATIPTLTGEERRALHDLARTFDAMPKREYVPTPGRDPAGGDRPGEDFAARATWADILIPHGWARLFASGGKTFWRRPGKDAGWSATTNYADSDLLYVFSSSTPFEPERGYGKFAAYAVLNHDGDFAAAARDLAAQGYGVPLQAGVRTLIGRATGAGDPSAAYAAPGEAAWPDPPDPLAFHGLAGEIVDALDPITEADRAAVVLSLLAAVGNVVGGDTYWQVNGRRHGLRLYPILVGPTSQGRKGTAWAALEPVLERAAPAWLDRCKVSGLSSGEGLIWAVRDPIEKNEPIREGGKRAGAILGYETVVEDPGVEDKRLFVVEEEFASTLKVMGRESNILSAVIRQAWDDGRLRTLTKTSPARATGAHVTILGHITRDELLRYLDNTEAANGFANRFVWACVRRSKVLPEGGQLDRATLDRLGARLEAACEAGRALGLLERDAEAAALWARVYEPLTDGGTGLLGAVTSRAAPQVMRLAAIYAVLDQSRRIRAEHLRAAVALWDYLAASAQYIFGDALGDPVADTILRALRAGGEFTQTELSNLFGRNIPAGRLDRALGLLLAAGKVRREARETGGRPAAIWRAA